MATVQDDVVRLEKSAGGRKLITTDCVYDLTEDKTQEAVNSDLKTSVSKILPVITGSTNNSGYTIVSGDYFEANGTLYKATASIPVDGTWSTSATAQSDTAVNSLKNSIEELSCTALNNFNKDPANRFKFYRYGNGNGGYVYILHLVGFYRASSSLSSESPLVYFDSDYAPSFQVFNMVKVGNGSTIEYSRTGIVKTENGRGEASVGYVFENNHWVWGTIMWMK